MFSNVAHDRDRPDSLQAMYRQALQAVHDARVPFLVGGAFALEQYVGITRRTHDLDLFVYPHDCSRVLTILQAAGYRTQMRFPHWLGKACCGAGCIDVIFSSGNGVARVDEAWFTHAVPGEVLGVPVALCPAEEMLWSKAYVMERERYDGADVLHLLRALGAQLDWERMLRRFGRHWRVLLSHLVLFGFVYPEEQGQVPQWVLHELLRRLAGSVMAVPAGVDRRCYGPLLSRAQYVIDITCWGYHDARLLPTGSMTAEEIAQWTAAIAEEKGTP